MKLLKILFDQARLNTIFGSESDISELFTGVVALCMGLQIIITFLLTGSVYHVDGLVIPSAYIGGIFFLLGLVQYLAWNSHDWAWQRTAAAFGAGCWFLYTLLIGFGRNITTHGVMPLAENHESVTISITFLLIWVYLRLGISQYSKVT